MLLSYIDKIETKKHILLVYDDVKKAREVVYHFIKRGLEKRERCIYLIHDDPKLIESDMERYGINVRNYKKNKMLHVNKITNIGNSESILNSLENMLCQINKDSKSAFRIVGRMLPNVGFEEAMAVQYGIENIFHEAMFEKLNGSCMCTYDMSQIKENNKWRDWLDKLESCHNATLLNICDKSQIKINA
jgi:MEDS: MEthanogen/methylotroph, DcmR Sensory domain